MQETGQNRGNFQNAFQTLGLNQKESDVYFSLLTMGGGKVSEIAKRAQINRTTAYDILGSLSNKGLIVISGKEPKQEYRCENPEKLLSFLQRDIEKKQENYRYAEILLPELKSIYKVGARPQVKFYEGPEGLEEVYEDTLTSTEPIRAYANVDEMHKALPNYFPKYYKRRAAKGIPIRAIIPKNSAGEERGSQDKYELRQSAFVSPQEFYFSPEINIYDNKVMIASWREKLGITIESAEIADAMKKIYELAWGRAKELDKELRKFNS
ncbi:MAG TPA: helix-turn-helix domain-containing protein [Candidatus Paceibacterota bacterium]|nr:helix-turn-helix domain-containing protein [Candidatus Paceibacterota bacterium]